MEQFNLDFDKVKIHGTDLQPEDFTRLGGQLKRVYELMIDGKRRSTYTIGSELNIPAASAHRHLSTLRTQYGFVIEKGLIGDGLWLYQIIKKGSAPKKIKKLKPIGQKELFGAMLQAIHAYGAVQSESNSEALTTALLNWGFNFAGQVGEVEYQV